MKTPVADSAHVHGGVAWWARHGLWEVRGDGEGVEVAMLQRFRFAEVAEGEVYLAP